MQLINEFKKGFTHGMRPFRVAFPLLLKGMLIMLAGALTGVLASLLGADTLGGAIIVFATIVGCVYWVLAWVRLIKSVHSGNEASS